MARLLVHIGRSGQPVETEWNNSDETVAIVRSFHQPPKFVIFDRPARGMQWLKANGPNDFDNLNEAIRHVSAQRDSRRKRRTHRRRDAQQPSWIVVDTERGNRVVGYHRGRVDAREDARERNRAANRSRYAYKPEYALEGVS